MKSINVKGIRFAKITAKADSGYTYSTPELVAGAMKVSEVPTPAEGELYEDGKLSERIAQVTGYELALDISRLPNDVRQYINGKTYTDGVETDDGACEPGAFAIGWETEYVVKGKVYRELIWYIDCLAKPIEKNTEQRQKDIKIGNSTVNITAFKSSAYTDRAYVMIDTADESVTEDMITNFFSKVQTGTTITAAS